MRYQLQELLESTLILLTYVASCYLCYYLGKRYRKTLRGNIKKDKVLFFSVALGVPLVLCFWLFPLMGVVGYRFTRYEVYLAQVVCVVFGVLKRPL